MTESSEEKQYLVLGPSPKYELVGVVAGKTAFEALMQVPPNHGIELAPVDTDEFVADFRNILDGVESNKQEE